MSDSSRVEPESAGAVKCVGETALALKVMKGTGMKAKTFWVPKSVVHEDSDVQGEGDEGELFVFRWYAEQEGL